MRKIERIFLITIPLMSGFLNDLPAPSRLFYYLSNMISISLLIMPYFTFLRRWVEDFETKFGKRYLMVTVWIKGWTRNSITRLGWEVKIKSIQKEEWPKMPVGSLVICCRSKLRSHIIDFGVRMLFCHAHTNLKIYY